MNFIDAASGEEVDVKYLRAPASCCCESKSRVAIGDLWGNVYYVEFESQVCYLFQKELDICTTVATQADTTTLL